MCDSFFSQYLMEDIYLYLRFIYCLCGCCRFISFVHWQNKKYINKLTVWWQMCFMLFWIKSQNTMYEKNVVYTTINRIKVSHHQIFLSYTIFIFPSHFLPSAAFSFFLFFFFKSKRMKAKSIAPFPLVPTRIDSPRIAKTQLGSTGLTLQSSNI